MAVHGDRGQNSYGVSNTPAVPPNYIKTYDDVFRLETPEGSPGEPPTFSAAVPNWAIGDCIYFGRRTLRVVDRRDDDAEQPPVLVVEDMPR